MVASTVGLRLSLGALNYPFTPFGNAVERDTHFLCERERHQIDDELLVGANLRYFMLERSRST
jgi:hypothetical protein